ncbi:toxin secretion/phage lysis holin [Ruminiclostridium sufflavum DSM 19573]|uniref:Toxin secretion/phage lysis holin n=1 Tax=Ruminiclostridium sufflavum DSM 19573 TaxID=1121337 RepID=A0A318XNI8_9FIRM|nr:phage holin family protein [Ruminiclostridium sufflavum]PYG88509.1 toxin secretion/phage lysis holin [Ruminiclostridium sufflavum DSM 19573]
MEKINAFKMTVTAVFAGISAALGWFGWLVVAFVACLAGDWISGSAAAAKKGEWSSKRGREGIWHKAGCIVVVLVAALLDIVIGTVINNITGIQLPFTYTVLLCPIVLVWYILTELGSVIENAGKMGAPIPAFLQKAIALFKGAVDTAGNKIIDNSDK